jgi:superfamily II DNA or RNA helicase
MEGIVKAGIGLSISRDTLANIIEKNKRILSVREKLPPNIPSSFKTQTRVLRLFRMLDKDNAVIGKSVGKLLLDKVDYNYKKIRKFDKFDLDGNLAPHQKVIINYVIACKFATGDMTGEVLLQVDTGLGKTRIGLGLIGKVGAVSAAIVPTKHIAQQWLDEITECAPQLKACIYNNTKNQSTNDYDVLIIVINTARNKDPSFFENFALVMIDEVHEITTKTNKNVLWNIAGCRFACGLTATPELGHNSLLRFIEGHLGGTLYAKDIPGFDINCKVFKVKVEIANYIGHNDFLQPVLNSGGTVSAICTIERIISDPSRLALTITKISELYDTGNNILVFAEHRKHLDALYEILKTKYKDAELEIEVDVLRGGAKKETIDRANTSRIILTTYGYSRRGISYAHLNALVLATPRRSGHRQILGRILRFNSDEKIERHVCDISDIGSVLKSQVYARLKVYKERRYKIVYTQHRAEDSDDN